MLFKNEMLRCYLIGGSQDTHHDPDDFLTKVEAAMQAGITAFQYREKGTSTLSKAETLAAGSASPGAGDQVRRAALCRRRPRAGGRHQGRRHPRRPKGLADRRGLPDDF